MRWTTIRVRDINTNSKKEADPCITKGEGQIDTRKFGPTLPLLRMQLRHPKKGPEINPAPQERKKRRKEKNSLNTGKQERH